LGRVFVHGSGFGCHLSAAKRSTRDAGDHERAAMQCLT
jgi:hypothetical protein